MALFTFRMSVACRAENAKASYWRRGSVEWACVANVDKDGSAVRPGVEAIGRPCLITSFGELSLLRMALDTIGYAVGRHAMETERTRAWRLGCNRPGAWRRSEH